MKTCGGWNGKWYRDASPGAGGIGRCLRSVRLTFDDSIGTFGGGGSELQDKTGELFSDGKSKDSSGCVSSVAGLRS